MSLTSVSVRRPVSTVAATIAIVLLGAVSLTRIPVSLLPDVSLPVLTIRTAYEGAAALALYSIGLAVPFLALAMGLERSHRLRRALLRRGLLIERIGGGLLVIVGIGYLSGWWSAMWVEMQGWLARTGWPPL